MHFPSHVRQSMLDWIDRGFAEFARIEVNYLPRPIATEDLLRQFLVPISCSDKMPKDYAAKIATHVGYARPVSDMSFAVAASTMLTAIESGPEAAQRYLEATLHAAQERRLFGPPAEEWWSGLSEVDREAFMLASLAPGALPAELADKLRAAGVHVIYGSWSNEPWFPVWPQRILKCVARKRSDAEREAALSPAR